MTPSATDSLNIVVCIEVVPSPDTEVRPFLAGQPLDRTGWEYETRFADDCALEAAVQLRENRDGELTAIVAGPAACEKAARERVARGADQSAFLEDPDWILLDVVSRARLFADVVRDYAPDLVLVGGGGSLLSMAPVGPAIAGALGWPLCSRVMGLDDSRALLVKRRANKEQVVAVRPPAVLTVHAGEIEPRYASLKSILHAKKLLVRCADAGAIEDQRHELLSASRAPRKARKVFEPELGIRALVDLVKRHGLIQGEPE